MVIALWLRPLAMRANVIVIGVPFLFVLLVAVVSLRRPILLPRFLAWTVVPLCLLAASELLEAGRARFAVLISLVDSFGSGLYFQVTTPGSEKEPWREAVHVFAPELERADLVVVAPLSDPMVLKYYASQVKNIRRNGFTSPPIKEPEILQAIENKHSVWVLSNGFDSCSCQWIAKPYTGYGAGLAGWLPR